MHAFLPYVEMKCCNLLFDIDVLYPYLSWMTTFYSVFLVQYINQPFSDQILHFLCTDLYFIFFFVPRFLIFFFCIAVSLPHFILFPVCSPSLLPVFSLTVLSMILLMIPASVLGARRKVQRVTFSAEPGLERGDVPSLQTQRLRGSPKSRRQDGAFMQYFCDQNKHSMRNKIITI